MGDGRIQKVTLVVKLPKVNLEAGYKISLLLRVPGALGGSFGIDSYIPVIMKLGQRREMKSTQLDRSGV